jgi:hypothetical protein
MIAFAYCNGRRSVEAVKNEKPGQFSKSSNLSNVDRVSDSALDFIARR